MHNQYLSNEELQFFHKICLTDNITHMKTHLSKYSSDIIMNTITRIIRGNSPTELIMYKNLLLADNLDLNKPSTLGGDTLLYSATVINNLWMVKDLVSRGANVNSCCINGSYPLISASVTPDRFEILEFLLEQKADTNIITNSGDTCLTYCVKTKSPLALSKLIEAGANVNFLDINNRYCLEHAIYHGLTANIIILCQSATDQKQIDEFKHQAHKSQDNSFYDFTISVLNSLETKMSLESSLKNSNFSKHKSPKI